MGWKLLVLGDAAVAHGANTSQLLSLAAALGEVIKDLFAFSRQSEGMNRQRRNLRGAVASEELTLVEEESLVASTETAAVNKGAGTVPILLALVDDP